nr:hypothetical protein [Clostridiales bacterium]
MQKAFFKDTIVKVATLVLLAATFGIYIFVAMNMLDGKLYWYHSLMGIVYFSPLFLFTFFTLLSYYFFLKIKEDHLEETFKSLNNGYFKVICKGMLNFVILAFGTMLLLLIGVLVSDLKSEHFGQIFGIVLNSLFFNIFLISMLGAFVGLTCSFTKLKSSGITAVLISIILFSPLNSILSKLFNAYGFARLFEIFDKSVKWADMFSVSFPDYSYRIQIMVGWILLCVAIIFLKTINLHKGLKITAVIMAGVSCVGFLAYSQLPASKPDAYGYDESCSFTEAQRYYLKDVPIKQEKPEFSVTKYEMQVKAKRELGVVATLSVDNANLESYKFTLCHNYRVNSVKDENGNKMDFVRDGDYIEVKSTAPTNKITIEYKGSSTQYFANSYGINLPGYFNYFPQAGYYSLFNKNVADYYRMFLSTSAEFDVTVDTNKEVFSNLEETEKNHFVGNAKSLTLMSGLYESYTTNGVEIIFPYTNKFAFDKSKFSTTIITLKAKGIIDENTTKIFSIPSVNQLSTNTVYAHETNYILIAGALENAEILYNQQLYLETKKNIKDVYDVLSTSITNFEEIRDMYAKKGSNGQFSKIYSYTDECIKMLGTDVVIE